MFCSLVVSMPSLFSFNCLHEFCLLSSVFYLLLCNILSSVVLQAVFSLILSFFVLSFVLLHVVFCHTICSLLPCYMLSSVFLQLVFCLVSSCLLFYAGHLRFTVQCVVDNPLSSGPDMLSSLSFSYFL